MRIAIAVLALSIGAGLALAPAGEGAALRKARVSVPLPADGHQMFAVATFTAKGARKPPPIKRVSANSASLPGDIRAGALVAGPRKVGGHWEYKMFVAINDLGSGSARAAQGADALELIVYAAAAEFGTPVTKKLLNGPCGEKYVREFKRWLRIGRWVELGNWGSPPQKIWENSLNGSKSNPDC
jgi:hypothetical protein